MKKFLSIFLLGTVCLSVTAQRVFTISGVVQDFHDKSKLKGAQIKAGNAAASTDEGGRYLLKPLAAGHYVVSAVHPGCDMVSVAIDLKRDTVINFSLEHHATEIQSVTLHGSHKNNGDLVVKTVDKEDIARNSTENLGNVLAGISGVSTLKTGNNIVKPVIHGLYGSRIAIMNNGVKMADQEWGAEHAPNVDINNFEHIDVIKGASALKYGSDAVGGVIVLEPEVFAKKDTLRGSANLAGISNGRGVGLDINLVKSWKNGWAVKANGGYKKLGDLQTPHYNLMNTGMEANSFGFTLQHNSYLQGISFDYSGINQTIGIYRGSDIGNLQDFYTAITSDVPIYKRSFSYTIDNPRQEISHQIAKVAAFRRFEDFGKVSVDYNFQYNHRKEYDVRRGELYDIPALDLALYTNQVNINDLLEREKWSLETGADLAYQFNYSTPETEAKRLIPNYDKYSGGAYSVFKYKITPTLKAEAGLRYDFTKYNVRMWYDTADWEALYADAFPQFYVKTDENRVYINPKLRFENLSYNAGLEYNPSRLFSLKFNYAKVGRTPNIAELFADGLHHSAAIIEVGDMRLKNEDGNQFNLEVDSKIDLLGGLQLSVNPYLFLTKNFITEIPTSIQNTIRGVFPVWSYEQVDAKMYGLDVDAMLKITDNLTWKGAYSYVYGQDTTHDVPLILMMPSNISNSLEFNKKEWDNFYLKVDHRYVMHQNRFPVYNPTIPLFQDGNEVQATLDLSTPPPAYSLWGFEAGADLGRHFTVGLRATNVFNENYKDYLNRLRFFSYEMGRNFILNIKYNF